MTADYFSAPIECRDAGQAQGSIQIRWSGFAGAGALFKLQCSHREDWGWSDMGGTEVEQSVTAASGTNTFLLDIQGVVKLRLAYLFGTGSAGAFDASYFIKGF